MSTVSGYFPSVSTIQNGVNVIAKSTVYGLASLPTSTLTMAGWAVALAIDYKPLTLSLIAAQAVWSSVKLYQCGSSSVSKVEKGLLYALALYELSGLVPVARAIEFNTFQQARDHYPGTGCEPEYSAAIRGPKACIIKGDQLQACAAVANKAYHNDFAIYTRHFAAGENDPVSIVRVNTDNTTVCMYSALDKTSGVTKTCFTDLTKGFDRTLEVLPAISMEDAHKGLEPGKSWSSIEVDAQCAYFHKHDTKVDVGPDAVCQLSAVVPGGPVSQTCFDPKNPTVITLKEADGVELEFPKDHDGKPISVIFRKPIQAGLDPTATAAKSSCKFVCDAKDEKDEL
jgi:hypothetical protein